MQRRDLLTTIILMFVIVGVTVGAAFLLNMHTAPIIEANKAGAANDALVAVLPEGKSFKEITTELTIEDASVIAVYEETTGKGYVFKSTAAGYSKTVEVTVGVTADGKVAGLTVNTNGDYAVNAGSLNSYIGQDSTLADVVHTSGATASSNAVKSAVNAGFLVLAANNKISAGKKAIEQVYEELIPSVYQGFIKGSDLTGNDTIYAAYKSSNDSIVVTYVNKGEDKLLAISSAAGLTKVYNANLLDEATQKYELVDVTSANSDVVTLVETFAKSAVNSKYDALVTKLGKMFANAADFTELSVPLFGDTVAAASFTVEGVTYYGFHTRPNNSFGPGPMDVYVVLNSEGKIVKSDASEYIINLHGFEYVNPTIGHFKVDEYLAQFVDFDSSSIQDADFEKGGQYNIAGATKTSVGFKDGLNSAFAAYNAIMGGNE